MTWAALSCHPVASGSPSQVAFLLSDLGLDTPFGCGLHPLAELRQQQLEGPDLTQRDYRDAARLGAPFKIIDGDVSRLEVARRYAAINTAAGLPAAAPLPATDRARVRTAVAREFFLATHRREPVDARELECASRDRTMLAGRGISPVCFKIGPLHRCPASKLQRWLSRLYRLESLA